LTKAFEHEHSIRALRISETRYRDIHKNIHDVWYLHDLENGKFIELNPVVEKITGYKREELLTMKISDLIPEKYKSRFFDYLARLKETGAAEGFMRILSKSGEEKILEYRNWIILDSNDGQGLSRGLVRDVTDRMKLEAQLRHSQKMESVGTIASGISHNFRNMLSGIISNSRLIQMKTEDNPELQNHCNEIFRLTKSGSELITGLLQFSRKSSDEPMNVANLAEILKETYDIISRSFNKKIEIRTEWSDLIPVYCDRSSLTQVFMNLCTNARDAMPDGGILTIKGQSAGTSIVVHISDTGIGIDEKVTEKVFDPFFTTKAEGKGTGLGLSTTYGIVKQHGGDISVISEKYNGTTFSVSLPLQETAGSGESENEESTIMGDGQKILIADDDENMLDPMIELLEGIGYHAFAVSSGEMALKQYTELKPDIVLLDRSMPVMDGPETAFKLLELDQNASIIIMSGYDENGPDGIDENTKKAIRAYIPKPFDISEISQILARVLKR